MHKMEMLAPSNSKPTDDSKIQHYFPNPSGFPKKMKMKTPLPPKYKSSSIVLPAASAKRSVILDKAIEYELKHGPKLRDPNMDRKKLRRTISNRLSAQRSRKKKSQHINDLEKTTNDLEDMIETLTSQVESHTDMQKQLLLENDSLENLVEIRSIESKISEFKLEQKWLEVCRLNELVETLNHWSSGPGHIQDSAPSSSFQQVNFTTEIPVKVLALENSQAEADIDQYLNFEEGLD